MFADPELQRIVDPELDGSEKTLWTGRPDPVRASLPMLGITVFGLFWTAFAVFFILTALGITSGSGRSHGGPPSTFMFGFLVIPSFFVLIGLGMITSPIWAYLKARKTVYAITNKRILIITAGSTRSVQSYDEHDVTCIERTERADGSWNLVFGQESYRTNNGNTASRQRMLAGIPHVKQVEALVRQTFLKEDTGAR